jgi:hypothetical protein
MHTLRSDRVGPVHKLTVCHHPWVCSMGFSLETTPGKELGAGKELCSPIRNVDFLEGADEVQPLDPASPVAGEFHL